MSATERGEEAFSCVDGERERRFSSRVIDPYNSRQNRREA